MNETTVLLRGAEKTWRHDAAVIMLKQIPLWFELIEYNHIYKAVAQEVYSEYLAGQTKLATLASFRVNDQLSLKNFSDLGSFCNRRQKTKVFLASMFPLAILRSLVLLRTKFRRLSAKIC